MNRKLINWVEKVSTKLFRIGIYLFAIMNWVSKIGYGMFPLSDAGKEIDTFYLFHGFRGAEQ